MKAKRLIFMLLALLSLVTGIWTGLIRMGAGLPFLNAMTHHGAIMTGGFLGTLICLEKAIPLKRGVFLAVPVISASSLLFFITGYNNMAIIALILAGLGLCSIYVVYLRRQYELSLFLMLSGAIAWTTGNVMLFTPGVYPQALAWWICFMLFTIVGERLELSKFLPITNRHKYALLLFLLVFLAGIGLTFHGSGKYLSASALILISTWLMRYDVVSVNLKKDRLTRFSGVALLGGYIALLLTGFFLMTLQRAPFGYDIIVHTFFLGFIFSMIFAHGPFILPALIGVPVKPYHLLFYLPLTLLLLSVTMRIAADVSLLPYSFRLVSGWISGGSILLYFVLLMTLTIRAVRRAKVF